MVSIAKPKIVKKTYTVPAEEDTRHKKKWFTKGHYVKRNGKRIWIPGHVNRAHKKHYKVRKHKVSRKEIRFGGHFNEVADKIAKEYEKKGYTKKEAQEIGKKTAAVIYRNKIAKAYSRG